MQSTKIHAELFDVAHYSTVFATHGFGLDVIRGCVNNRIDIYFILLNVTIFGVKKFKNAIDDDVIRTQNRTPLASRGKHSTIGSVTARRQPTPINHKCFI